MQQHALKGFLTSVESRMKTFLARCKYGENEFSWGTKLLTSLFSEILYRRLRVGNIWLLQDWRTLRAKRQKKRMENVDSTVDRRPIQGAETKMERRKSLFLRALINKWSSASQAQHGWDVPEHQWSCMWWCNGVWYIYTIQQHDMWNCRKYEICRWWDMLSVRAAVKLPQPAAALFLPVFSFITPVFVCIQRDLGIKLIAFKPLTDTLLEPTGASLSYNLFLTILKSLFFYKEIKH